MTNAIITNMEDLTDDMKTVLKAAYRAGPDGEEFYLEELDLHGMSEQAIADCGFALTPLKYPYLTEMGKDSRGTKLYLTKFGRPIAKQLVADERKDRLKTLNAALQWIAIAILGGLFTVGFNILDRRIQRWQIAPTTQQKSP